MHRFTLRVFLVLLFVVAGLGASIIMPASAQCTPRADWGIYVVAHGDTVFGIARRFGVSPTALIQGNCLINPNRVYVGQQFRVPTGTGPNPWPGGAPEYPYAASHIGSTFQQFENGFMTWRADTGSIWVFVNQGSGGYVSAYPNDVYGGLSIRTSYAPIPPGRTLPVFGFRKVYDNFPDVRAALGWGIGSEQGFLMAVQPFPHKLYFTISLPDQRVIRINNDRTWHPDSGTPPPPPPPPPIYTTGATFQPFQSGFMVWRADTGDIRVYIGSTTGELLVYPVSQYGPLPDRPYLLPTPGYPYVLVQFGFAKVWYNIAGIRDRIGWATGSEQGYTMTVNETPGARSFTLPGGFTLTQVSGSTWAISGAAGVPFGQVPPTPTPTPTAEPNSTGPQLSLYTVTPPVAMPGEPISVNWEVANAGNVGLMVKYQADYRLFLDYTSVALPPSGSHTVTLPTHTDVFNTEASFQLFWANDAAPENWTPIDGGAMTVQIGCPTPLFWKADGCAYAPVQELAAVYQPFERGFMLRAGEAIYSVIFNDAHEANIYAELERVELGTPPDSLYVPDAVFVETWTSTPLYQERLGWAMAPAEAYTAQVQTAHYRIRDTTQQHYVTMPDGRILMLSGSAFGGPAIRWDWAE